MSAVTKAAPAAYVVFGPPGCGKGTFAKAIVPNGYEHLSTGNITRQEVERGTEFGIKYKDIILDPQHAGLIPSEDIEKLLMQRMESALDNQKGIIFDGYPKTLEQCQFLDNFFATKGLKDRVVIVMLDVKDEIAIDRIIHRQTCDKCNAVYNTVSSPPKKTGECDKCQAPLGQRADFTVDGTKERVSKFKPKMEMFLKYYGARLRHVDVNGSHDECLIGFTKLHNSFVKA